MTLCHPRYTASGAPMAPSAPIRLEIQLLCGDEIAMRFGKADLLDLIVQLGSISAAARAMNMSEADRQILATYRRLQAAVTGVADDAEWMRLCTALRDLPKLPGAFSVELTSKRRNV